jgi:hypothetical protein
MTFAFRWPCPAIALILLSFREIKAISDAAKKALIKIKMKTTKSSNNPMHLHKFPTPLKRVTNAKKHNLPSLN